MNTRTKTRKLNKIVKDAIMMKPLFKENFKTIEALYNKNKIKRIDYADKLIDGLLKNNINTNNKTINTLNKYENINIPKIFKTKKTMKIDKIIKEIDNSYNVQIDKNLNAKMNVQILNIYTDEKTLFTTENYDKIKTNFDKLYDTIPNKNFNFGIAIRGIRVDERTMEEDEIVTLFKSYISNNLDDGLKKMLNSGKIMTTSGYYYYIKQYQLFYEMDQGGAYKKQIYEDIKNYTIFNPLSKKSCGHFCLKYFNIDSPKGYLSLSDVKALSPVPVSDKILDDDEYILLRDEHFIIVIKTDILKKRKRIKKRENNKMKKLRHIEEMDKKIICVFDIECFGKFQRPLAIGFTYDGIEFSHYYGENCVEEFIKNLNCDYLIGFNSNKYDNILLRNEILKDGYLIEDIVRSENNIIKTIISKKDKKIEFVDILNFTSGTLKKNLLNFRCNTAKGEINFNKLSFNMNEDDKKLMLEYLKNDVLGTYELYKKLNEPFKMFNLSILELYTLSQGAFKIIKDIWKESGILQERQNRDVDNFLRKAIYGGRCEVFKRHFISNEYKQIKQGKIKYDDITDYLLAPDVNSLYPYIMKENKYPIGEPKLTTMEIMDKLAIYKCSIKKPKNLLYPILCSSGEYNLNDGEGVYTSIDIQEARRRGYIINVISGYYWEEKQNIFGEYIDTFYEIKKNSPKSSPQYSNSKLMMNGIYGKTMQQDKNIINYTVSDALEMINMKKGKDIKKFSGIFIGDVGYFEYEDTLHLMTDKKAHIGAFILSYSKIILNNLFSDVEPYYTDTDSIYIHVKHQDKLEWGNELGQFSNDVNGKIICAYFIAKKLKFVEILKPNNEIEYCYTGKGCDTKTMTKNNFKKMLKGLEVENITTLNFKRRVRGGSIEKKENLIKTIKMNDGKRIFLTDNSSIPYGFLI